ncbi:molybdopterin-dependent oxidoreductase [Streptomyces sp. DSM 44917]|uniref:Molybdopterin-dependent oxidoreductase n=1 Tax=Streptomyces boetiae TaxID=3075541 RepID=A0ABU2L8H8_9ACTN|nr:molybdopterin-dependent oxidoreductase [Streptomyces sp. DSM 44917]MDT0307878.1 molybdopterin-dependent oxidoreductase [Streptomyces sp. DSM 44917]
MTDTRETDTPRTARAGAAGRRALGALAGLLAAAAGLAVGEPVSAAVRREAAPVTAVGDAVIELAPAGVTRWSIDTFGDSDKLVLEAGVVALLGLFAAALGVLAARDRRAGAAGALLFGLVGVTAAVTRPDGGPSDAWPSVAAGLAAAVVLTLLARRLPAAAGTGAAPDSASAGGLRPADAAATAEAARPAGTPDPGPAADAGQAPGTGPRRAFLVSAGAVAAGSGGAWLLGRRLHDGEAARAAGARASLTLPAPDDPAGALPAGTDLGVDGVGPFLTPNDRFYRIDTALRVPRLDARAWRLRIHGAGVPRPLTIGYARLLERELVERDITLACVSNPVGGTLVGNARWLGVRLEELLREAGVRPPSAGGEADQLVARSADGMTLGTPVEAVMDGRDALLAVGMNGEPLPFEHGYPVRMVVPGLYGYVSACKWLVDLELTSFDAFDAYWVRRGWARQAPVKTQSRIDTPRSGARLRAGRVPVAGVAWAQHTGIDAVQVRVDEGPWRNARLAEEDTADTWRQWVWDWDAEPGGHRLQVRAVDRSGETQTADVSGSAPDGATGRHTVTVEVTD